MRYPLAFVVVCTGSVCGQNSVSINSAPESNGFSAIAHFGAPMPFASRAVTGAPYSGEETFETIQTLEDGTHITHSSGVTKMYRDSLGRTRRERPLSPATVVAEHPEAPVIIEISDPVAHVRYTLDSGNKVAHRQQLQSAADIANRVPSPGSAVPAGMIGGASGSASVGAAKVTGPSSNVSTLPALSQRPHPQSSNESLGTQIIEGVLAEGTRVTTIWPVGALRNDQPISMVVENWTSHELKVLVLSTINDPRVGKSTRKLTNISRAEPPADLFEPPPNYTVVDDTGDFTIKWGTSQ